MFNAFIESIQCIFAGMSVGFDAVFQMFPIYQQLDGLKTKMVAWIIGVPVAVVIALFFVLKCITFLISKVRK